MAAQTPKKHTGKSNMVGLRQSDVFTSTPINDDEAERSKRRMSAHLTRQLSNTSLQSSNSSSSTNSYSPISVENIKSHYETCMKMYAENKINVKNVWNLYIIEFMSSLLEQTTGAAVNVLQVASTSLDISAKVYGLRVDDVHGHVLKLANDMARSEQKTSKNADDDDDDGIANDDGEGDQTANEKQKQTKRKHQRRGNQITVAANANNLNVEIETVNIMTLELNSTDNNTTETMTIFTYPRHTYCYSFLFETQNLFEKPPKENSQIQNRVALTMPDIDDTVSICPALSNFILDQWDPNQSDYTQRKSTDAVVHDENGIPIPELDISQNFLSDSRPNSDFSDAEGEEIGQNHMTGRPEVVHVVDFQPTQHTGETLEYSYRPANRTNSRFCISEIWAGPEHWKIKHITHRIPNRLTKPAQPQTQKRAKAQPQPLTLQENVEDHLVFGRRNLTRNTVQNSVNKFTLPEDLCIRPEDLYSLWLKPKHSVHIKKPQLGGNTSRVNLNSVYNYDNPNDADYCSQIMNDDHFGDDNFDSHRSDTSNHFNGDNLVDAPEMVPNSYIAYAARAKRMDMRKLKTVVWENIVHISGNDTVPEIEMVATPIKETLFSEVYRDISLKLPGNMAEDLSVSMAFVSLLQITNERSLALESFNDYSDVRIYRSQIGM